MKITLSTACVLVMVLVGPLRAADDARLAAVRAADDARVAAIIAADRSRLTEIFSDDLRYAHSTGAVDSKASYIDALVTGRTKYLSIDYESRDFSLVCPEIALMSGRAHVMVSSSTGKVDTVLGFLAVYREEYGKWRFLAWQSCKIPPTTKPAK